MKTHRIRRALIGLLPFLLAPLGADAAQRIKDLSLLGTSHLLDGQAFLVDSGATFTVSSGGFLNVAGILTIQSGGSIVAASGSTVTGFGGGGGGGAGVWGSITGNLTDQSDLNTALGLRVLTTTLNGYFSDPSTHGSFSASAWRSDLGLVAIASSGSAADITTGTLSPDRLGSGTGLQVVRRNAGNTALEYATISVGGGDLLAANNLSDLASASQARTNLGLVAIASSGSASDLSAGTLPDARFPATLPAASGVNLTALNASNLGSGTIPDARFPATLPAASGANLSALNASNISSGTLAPDRLGSGTGLQVVRRNAGNTALEYATISVGGGDLLAANNLSDLASASQARINLGLVAVASSGSASDLSAGTLPDARFPATLPAASGVNLTALNASNLGSGTVPDARLPGALATWGAITPASGVGTFLATPTSANLRSALTDKTGLGAAVFQQDPVLLTPNAAMGALAIDTTKRVNTKSVSADSTLTFSATPTAGATFGLVLTNSDASAHTITIPSSYSLARSTAITSFTIRATSTVELSWRYDGTTYYLAGEPFLLNDLTTVTPASGDFVPFYDVDGNVDGKATIANLVAPLIGTSLQAYDANLATWATITAGTGVGAALANNIGSAGAVVVIGGALGTPASGNLTNAVGLPQAGTVGLTTADSPQFAAVNLGDVSDTTLSRVSAGVMAVEGNTVVTKNSNVREFSLTIDSIADGQSYTVTKVPAAFTVSQITAVHEGSGLSSPSVVVTVKHGTDRTSLTTVEAVTVTSSTTGTNDDGTLADATIPANSWIVVELSSKSGTTANLNVTIFGTYD